MQFSKEIKLCYKDIVKRIKFPENFKELINYVKDSFEINNRTYITFYFIDNENDKILISNEEEFKGASLFMEKFKFDLIKFFIQTSDIHEERREDNENLNQFVKDFVIFCFKNYNKISSYKENAKNEKNTISTQNKESIMRAQKLHSWVRKACVNIKKTDDNEGNFYTQMEGVSSIKIRHTYTVDNKKQIKTKVVPIKRDSFDIKWTDEYAILKIENLLRNIYNNFNNLEKEYDLTKF